MNKPDDPSAPEIPDPSERMEAAFVDGVHPALLELELLLSQCDLRFQRRSGPGGQHRNKTSSGVFLEHEPTGVIAEATERRSQGDNRNVALQRLRFRLAVEVRTVSMIDSAVASEEDELHKKFHGRPLKINDANEIKPAVMALILNDLHAAGGQPSAVASHWATSTSGIVSFVKSHHPAFAMVNAIRAHHGRRPLK